MNKQSGESYFPLLSDVFFFSPKTKDCCDWVGASLRKTAVPFAQWRARWKNGTGKRFPWFSFISFFAGSHNNNILRFTRCTGLIETHFSFYHFVHNLEKAADCQKHFLWHFQKTSQHGSIDKVSHKRAYIGFCRIRSIAYFIWSYLFVRKDFSWHLALHLCEKIFRDI